jgi:hypothetical protein
MKMSLIKKYVVMILITMLVVTQVECDAPSPSQELCEAKCDISCTQFKQMEEFLKCVQDCEKNAHHLS